MRTKLAWIKGPWTGKIAVLPRPRGGDWLEDEIEGWRGADADAVASLLTKSEIDELGLTDESRLAHRHGLAFLSFPINDRSVPVSQGDTLDFVKQIDRLLTDGKNVVIHCRGGLGRAPLIAACLLASVGENPDIAFRRIGDARGTTVPEMPEQRDWVQNFALALTP